MKQLVQTTNSNAPLSITQIIAMNECLADYIVKPNDMVESMLFQHISNDTPESIRQLARDTALLHGLGIRIIYMTAIPYAQDEIEQVGYFAVDTWVLAR